MEKFITLSDPLKKLGLDWGGEAFSRSDRKGFPDLIKSFLFLALEGDSAPGCAGRGGWAGCGRRGGSSVRLQPPPALLLPALASRPSRISESHRTS